MSGTVTPTILNQTTSIPAYAVPVASAGPVASVTASPVSGTPTASVAPQTGPGVSSQSSLASITLEEIQAVRARSTISQARAPEAEVTGLFGGLPIFDQGPTRTSSVRDVVPTSGAQNSSKKTKEPDPTSKIPQEDLIKYDQARLEILKRELPDLGVSKVCIDIVFSYLRQTPIPVQDVVANFTDENVIQIVLSYAGDPTIQQTNDLAFKFILDAYSEQRLLSRFFITPSAVFQGQHRQVVMDLFNRVLSLSSQPALLPGIQRALRTGAPLALSPIVELAAPTLDKDTITVFRKIAKKIPEAKNFLKSDGISLLGIAEKAARIRTWLNENRALLGNVTELNLERLNLSTVPQEIIELFTNLQTLNLAHNQLTHIPDLRLPALQKLYLPLNQLATVPDFTHLQNLQQLWLQDNLLTAVPDFSHLQNLQFLSLDGNQLTAVPDFSHLQNLQRLNIEINQLTAVPDFSHLPNLKRLSLHKNHLTAVPDFNQLQSLQSCKLSDNRLRAVPDFSHLQNLENLFLLRNQLTTVPDFRYLQSLKMLDLTANPLTSIPSFEQLHSRGCQIQGI